MQTLDAEQKRDLRFPLDELEAEGRLSFILMKKSKTDYFLNEGAFGPREEVSYRLPQDAPAGSVTLYLPQSLSFADKVSYANEETGTLGSMLADNVRKSGFNTEAFKGTLVDQFNSFKSDAEGAGKLAILRTLGRVGSGTSLEAAARAEARVSINPNFRTLMENVPIRSFQFTFKLIPKNEIEAREIELIVKFFRTNLYPRKIIGNQSYSVGYEFPDTFRIEGFTGRFADRELPHGYLPCFLTDVNVTYNGESRGYFEDGRFVTYELGLSFTEIRALSREDVEKGGF